MDKIQLTVRKEKEAEALCLDILNKTGVPDDEAAIITWSLIDAEKRGVHSHGLVCLPRYVGLMRQGVMRKSTQIEVCRNSRCIQVWDGLRSNAQVLGYRAMENAMEMAAREGVGIVAVKSSNHFGAGAFYAQKALERDMVGIVLSTGSPTMAPWGGAERMIGNNPLSVAVPAREQEPLVLDMAQSVVAFGRITNMQKQGAEMIPGGWALDSEGAETQNAGEVYSVLPLGQYKGFGMALIVDVLSGILFGGATGVRADDRIDGPSQLFAALKVDSFGDKETYFREIDKRIQELKQSRLAKNSKGIYMPGEIEYINKEKSKDRVECLPEVYAELEQLREELTN